MGVFRGKLSQAACAVLGKQTSRLRRLDATRRFLDFRRRWQHAPTMAFDYAERPQFYRRVYESVLGEQAGPIDFLEFGSYRGESMRAWARIDTHPESRFFGFDSFEGLPEHWRAGAPEGTFSVAGQIPAVEDPRVQFIPGLFQETLPRFVRETPLRDRLVLHLDADLYSSTLFALVTVCPPPGALLFFDEFSDVMHEFRAFQDYLSACQRAYEVVMTRPDFGKIAIQLQ